MSNKLDFFDLPAELMAAIGTVLGFALLDDLNAAQQNSLGNFLMLIAQVLETNSAQKQLLSGNEQQKRIDNIELSIKRIEDFLGIDCNNPPSL